MDDCSYFSNESDLWKSLLRRSSFWARCVLFKYIFLQCLPSRTNNFVSYPHKTKPIQNIKYSGLKQSTARENCSAPKDNPINAVDSYRTESHIPKKKNSSNIVLNKKTLHYLQRLYHIKIAPKALSTLDESTSVLVVRLKSPNGGRIALVRNYSLSYIFFVILLLKYLAFSVFL